MSPTTRQQIERRIVRQIIHTTLAQGFSISVDDGEDIVVKHSRNSREILKAMFSVDEERLHIHAPEPDHARIGWIFLVYGNDGWDVINDYTTNLESILTPANALADKLQS